MDCDTFLAENNALKMKLQSKTEALKILSKELSECKKERDRLSLLLEDKTYFQHQHLHDQPKLYGLNVDDINYAENREIQIIKDKNKLLLLEIEDLKQRLNSVQGDMKVLRRDRNGSRESTMSVENNVSWHQREELIQELEETKAKVRHLSTDLQALLDEKEELVTERDAYRCKVHRLNHELAVLLKADTPPIDIDSLIMENKYVKDRCDQILAEKEIVIQSLRKYKAMLDKKKMKGNVRLGANTSDMVVTHKQVHELLDADGAVWTSPYNAEATLSDLRSLSLALLDALQDKTVALTHQRRANKILADRVSNLESRLSKQKPIYPSNYLLSGYTSSQVDKDINILSIKSSLSSESKLSADAEEPIDEEKGEDEDQEDCSSPSTIGSYQLCLPAAPNIFI
ncbi:hypothetical protein O3M35_003651 [Rhynocoris fuscipes]|uniref:Coiled-coil domain-containing protein 149 n=1 Tax=Rhynocoris fuscipes TaxID=488301 RepID=A0AAW1CSA5_9HEMI